MNVIITTHQFQSIYAHFLDRKPNMIIDGIFSKLLYSNHHFVMNGLFIDISLQSISPKKYNSSFIEFDVSSNKDMMKRISEIEKQILQNYADYFQITNKTPVYDLSYKLHSGSLKYYSSSIQNKYPIVKPEYFVKISGIWETIHQYGITYKIIEYRPK